MSGQRRGKAPRGGSKKLLYRPERVAVERGIDTRLTEMSGKFIGQGLRDATDPRLIR
jgi:hypothetical protein